MILMRILPGVLKELSKHVPTVLFQTVEWSELVSELPKISRRILQKDGYDALFNFQKALVAPFDITLSKNLPAAINLDQNKWAGEKILELYFAQLFSSRGVFIDLRPTHFEEQRPLFVFNPSGLWTQFEEPFRKGILNVYEGFYLENNDLYFQGLTDIGLIQSDWSEEDKNNLGEIFKAQFGSALTQEMAFDLEHFKESIIKMSQFMLEKKVKISKDFLYLGIYLVTMYSTLEQTKCKLPVKNIYLSVKDKLSE